MNLRVRSPAVVVTHLLLFIGYWHCAHGTTIISIKYPPSSISVERAQPAKRDLSLSYAATNIDSKEGTRVKTITVIKNVGNIDDLGTPANKQQKLAINPELHKNEEWATAFRDNFDSYGVLPDVPDIDDLFEFVNRKKPSVAMAEPHADIPKGEEKKPAAESTTEAKSLMETTATMAAASAAESRDDSDEAIVEKIKGDAELLPHIKQVNILRLQALAANASRSVAEPQGRRLRTRESLINVNYSTPMHKVMQYYDNYVQALPNGYDYSKPCAYPPPNSIPVTTPSGRTYDIPRGNSSGSGNINNPYLAPNLNKKTQVQQTLPPPTSLPPNYTSVNSIVPPIVQQAGNFPLPPQQPLPPNVSVLPPLQQPQLPVAGLGTQQPPLGNSAGPSTSQRPYVAPSLRNNGLGINRGPPTLPPLGPQQPVYRNGFNFRSNVFGGGANRPNTFRSRGLKY